jgi:phosphoglycerate kinase
LQHNTPIFLPIDGTIKNRESNVVLSTDIANIRKSDNIMDIGKETRKYFIHILQSAQTVVWAGTLGVTDDVEFCRGSLSMANACAKYTKYGVTTIIGGGDTAAFILQAGLEKQYTHLSTAGSAFLEFIAGNHLPALDAIIESQKRFSLI